MYDLEQPDCNNISHDLVSLRGEMESVIPEFFALGNIQRVIGNGAMEVESVSVSEVSFLSGNILGFLATERVNSQSSFLMISDFRVEIVTFCQ